MAWSWRLETADGRITGGPAELPEETWTTQADAESWIGEHWRVLAEHGVQQVFLLDDEHVVYGPMKLEEAG